MIIETPSGLPARSQTVEPSPGTAPDSSLSTETVTAPFERRREFKTLFDTMLDPVLVADDRARYIDANPAACLLLGYSREELLKLSVHDLAASNQPGQTEAAWAYFIAEGQLCGEFEMLRKDGAVLEVEFRAVANVRPGAHISVLRDITARKHHEEELERRVAERTDELARANAALTAEIVERQLKDSALRVTLIELQKAKEEAEQANQAKNEFLSRMSHELRTPLHAILGFGHLLAKGELNEVDREAVDFILSGGNHLLGLINEVLDIARIEAGNLSISLEPIAVSPAIGDVLEIVRPLATPRGIELINEIDSESEWRIKADHQRFRQILLNLLSNAIKYNRDGGRVTVAACCIASNPHFLHFEVRDTGLGLSAEELRKIFTPFERLKAARLGIEGSGIGLSITQKLVEAMGGRIGIESVLGEGSTFWLDLPLSHDSLEEIVAHDFAPDEILAVEQTGPEAVKTILYIEDNPINLRLMQAKFDRFPGYELQTANRGSLGLEMAREFAYDLILLDLHLPDLHGSDVLKLLKADAATESIPVVVLSADAIPAQVERLTLDGANAYLTKPLDLAVLRTVIEDVLKAKVD